MPRRPQPRRTEPGRTFSYTVDGEDRFGRADSDGILKIDHPELERIANREGLGYADDDDEDATE